ncbi:MAG: ROK family glucokinase [Propionibacteriaceae bacterium]
MLSIGLDIGGTKIAAGVVDDTGAIVDKVVVPSPTRSAQAAEDTIIDIVDDFRSRYDVMSVGVGAAGWVDTDQAIVRFSPHLAWRNEPLRDRLQSRIQLPVIVDNDANAAAWAEYRYGAGRGSRVMVCVTLGTGIGGALIINGQLFRGRYGMAGEWGHMTMVPDGHWCPCGNRGCWEQYASGNALVRDAKALAAQGSPRAAMLMEQAHGDSDLLTGAAVTAAALAGDSASRELIADVGRWLGVGLANLAAALDPDRFVIGGGVSEAGDLLLDPARTVFQRSLTGRGYRDEATIVAATTLNDAGLIGAADLACRSIIEPPGALRGFWPKRRTPSRHRLREALGLPLIPHN